MTEFQDERRRLPSASEWSRHEGCGASYQLSLEAKKLGQEAHSAPSEASATGDRIHTKLAGGKVDLTESEATTVDFLSQRALGEVKRIFDGDDPVEELIEQRWWLKVDGKAVATGRADRAYHRGEVGLIQDFKSGWSPPDPAAINSQLKVLAVLFAIEFQQITTVHAQIISGPYGVTETIYDLKRLSEAYREIRQTLRKINDPHAAFSPSPEACQYCPGKLICPALQERRITIAEMNLLTLPDGPQASMILDDVAIIRSRCDEIVAYYEGKLLADPSYDLPGYKMEQGAPRRAVSDWIAARAKLEEFVSAEALDQLAAYSIPAVEKVLGEAIGVRGPKLKDQFSTILGDLLELKYPEPGLKRVKVANLKALEAT